MVQREDDSLRLASDDAVRRRRAIEEVLSTEVTYRRRLTILHEVFYQASTRPGLLTRDERDDIFLNLEELLLRSGLLIAELEDAREVAKLATVFLKHSQHLGVSFERYCVGHREAGALLSDVASESNLFSAFLTQNSADPRCESLDLSSFLLEPVQRVARYPLLLRQVGCLLLRRFRETNDVALIPQTLFFVSLPGHAYHRSDLI